MPSGTQSIRPVLSLTLTALFGFQVGVVGLTGAVAVPGAASAESDVELAAMRSHWQEQYRRLLRNQATLEENIAKSKKDYAQAQRRNYPRGGAREKFRLQAEQAATELEETKQEIGVLFEDARKAGVPPGWLYEVQDETIVANQPAAADGVADEEDRAGRNPLYFDDDEKEDDR